MKNKLIKIIVITILMSTRFCRTPALAEEINPPMQTSNQTLMEAARTPEETKSTQVKSENVAMKIPPITNIQKTNKEGSHIVRNVATVAVVGAATVVAVYFGAAILIFALMAGVS